MFLINGGLDIMFIFFFPLEFFLFLVLLGVCGKRNELERVLLTSCGLCFGGYCGQYECLSASDIYGQN